MKSVGERIKYFRKKRKMTQEQLAELTGIHPVSIRKYETNKMQPQIEQIERIAATLQVNANAIIGYNGAPTRVDTVGDLMGLLMTLYRARVLLIVGDHDEDFSIKPETAKITINPALAGFFRVLSPNDSENSSGLSDIIVTLRDTDCLQDFLTWAVCCLGYEEMKRATTEQLEMSGFIEERLEEIELHMLSNAEPLNQYMSDSPYLLGHIPDKMDDDFSPLFSENP